jgi:hypothetical protein
MDKYKVWLMGMIKMCDLERQATIQKYGEDTAQFFMSEIEARKKVYEQCFKKYTAESDSDAQ